MSDQKEIRVFGPPGCGKTTLLTKLIAQEQEDRDPDEILVSAFSKTSARELASRNEEIKNLGTLHSLCYHLLGKPQIVESKKWIQEWNHTHPTYSMQYQNQELDIDNPYEEAGVNGVEEFQDYQRNRALMLPRRSWRVSTLKFAKLWESFKDQTNTLDYTDLIERNTAPEAENPVATIGFFDEVQDFSPLELALVRKWSAQMERYYLAGDDDQAIYGFKGAQPDSFLYPELPPEQKIILSQSYRLPKAIHAQAVQWAERIHPREPKEYYPREAEGVVRHAPYDFQNPDALLRDIQRDLNEYKTVMVLGSCKYMLDPLIDLLRVGGFPFHNPYRKKNGRWNPLVHSRDQTSAADRVCAFLKPQKEIWGEAQWWTYFDFHAWAKMVHAKVWKRGSKTRMEELAREHGHMKVKEEEFMAWTEREGDREAILYGDLNWFAKNLTKTAQKQLAYALKIAERQGPQLLREKPRILVGTIHSVKGGEAESVYLFPDLSNRAQEEWSNSRRGQMEIRRLFYVGMTRAKEKLTYCLDRGGADVWTA